MGRVMTERRGWWRGNAVALCAVAVLLLAAIGGAGWWEWKYAYPDSGKPLWAVEPGESGTVVLEGAEWGPVRAKAITDTSGLTVPDDTTLIGVTVQITPLGEKGPTCWAPRLIEQGTGRVWESVRGQIGLPWDREEPEVCVPTLDGETAEPYQLLLPYVVPEDAEGPYRLEIEPHDAESRFLRFSIDP